MTLLRNFVTLLETPVSRMMGSGRGILVTTPGLRKLKMKIFEIFQKIFTQNSFIVETRMVELQIQI